MSTLNTTGSSEGVNITVSTPSMPAPNSSSQAILSSSDTSILSSTTNTSSQLNMQLSLANQQQSQPTLQQLPPNQQLITNLQQPLLTQQQPLLNQQQPLLNELQSQPQSNQIPYQSYVPQSATTYVPSNSYRYPLPKFREEDVEFSIQQISLSFTPQATEHEKANTFLLTIPYDVQKSIPNLYQLVSSSPTPFTTLCDLLRRRLSPSDATRFHVLLRHETLGDRLPSQLLTRMLSISGPLAQGHQSLLRTLFLERLPDYVRNSLLSHGDALSLQDLAERADIIIRANQSVPSYVSPSSLSPLASTFAIMPSGVIPPSVPSTLSDPLPASSSSIPSPICAISPHPPSSSHSDSYSTILTMLNNMNAQLLSLDRKYNALQQQLSTATRCTCQHPSSDSSSFSRSRSRSPSPSRSPLPQPPPGSNLCFYHYNFGGRARKCVAPCSFSSLNSLQGGT